MTSGPSSVAREFDILSWKMGVIFISGGNFHIPIKFYSTGELLLSREMAVNEALHVIGTAF